MPTLSISIKDSDLAYVDQSLSAIANGANRALVSALGEATRSTRAEMVRVERADINLSAADVRQLTTIEHRPSANDPTGVIGVAYQGVRLDDFKPNPTPREGQGGGGIGRVMLKDKGGIRFRHGFAAPFKTGHVGLLIRKGPKRPATKGDYAGRILERGPNKGQLMLRQAVVDVIGAPLVDVYELEPSNLNAVAAFAADKLHERALSKVEWLLARGNANFPTAQ